MATSFEFEAIGTHWRIDIDEDVADARRGAVGDRIAARIAVFDKDYSRFREDSLVWKMSEESGTYELPEDAEPMLAMYEHAYRATKGAVTPLIGKTLVEAGYDHAYTLVPGELHQPPAWDDVLTYEPPRRLTLSRPALLDFGAIGKGYLIDIVSAILWDEGLRSYCVDAGGDMTHRSAAGKPLRVGLEHPEDETKVIGAVTLAPGMSLCGSAGNRRAWGEYHHIIDPRSLRSPRDIQAVWVVAESTLLADAMTSCLYFVPPEDLTDFRFEYLVLRPGERATMSRGFPAELFLK
jgi:FAD:protein FMN transferase